MMFVIRNIILTTVSITLFGCSIRKIQNSYPKDDFVFISDYVFSIDSKRYIERADPDSVFNIFKQSFRNLNLKEKYGQRSLNADIDFNLHWFRPNKIDTVSVKAIAARHPNEVVLVPIIFFNNGYYSSENYVSILRIIIFIVKDNQIIYSNREERPVSVRHVDYNNYEELIRHSQEEWDELVKEVMQPYIDRLK